MRHAACVLVVRESDGAVLAVSRPDPPLRFGLPGGVVDPGETHVEAAARELQEETGYLPASLYFLHQHTRDGTHVKTYYAPIVIGSLKSSHEGVARWVEPRVLACPGAAFPEDARQVFDAAGVAWRC